MIRALIATLLLASCAWLLGCERGTRDHIPAAAEPETKTKAFTTEIPDDFERTRWIQKVARTLRGGRGLTNPKELDELAKKSDAEIVDHFLAQPEFADTVLDFNLHFLGFRRDFVREPNGEIVADVFDFPSAIRGAIEVRKGGDYLKFLELEQPLYQPRLNSPSIEEEKRLGLSDEKARAKLYREIQDGLLVQIREIEQNPGTPIEKLCTRFMNEHEEGGQLQKIGITYGLMDLGFNTNMWYGKLSEACIGPFRPKDLDFKAELNRIHQENKRLFKALEKFEPARYSTRDLRDVRALDIKAIGMAPRWHMFGNPHRQSLMNSSTNFNRKRAAYVLDRFFCDNLTPINVESTGEHTGGAHGSEPACMACHYKLDPMAGFFRDFGYLFSDYRKSDQIRFDDNASAYTEEYSKAWLAPKDAGRTWNVGFIRSASRQDLNVYGSELEDLFRIIKTEPEVKRCIVKRMFEYYAGIDQTLDVGFLEYLTNEFVTVAKADSTRAFKEVSKMIVLGQTFRESDPQTDVCYDYPPGYDPAGKPPCKVARILEKNCASCHFSTFDKPFLDLTAWEIQADGKYSFPHLDKDGNQLPPHQTFEKILDRLSTQDPERRMPLKKHMDTLDREALFKWVMDVLNEGFKGPFLKVSFKKENACPAVP